MVSSLLALAAAGALLASRAVHAQSCRCLPGEPCWPSDAAFDSLSSRLSQPVFAVHPLAYPCHDPQFDKAACDVVKANSFDAQWRTNQPGAAEFENWASSADMMDVCASGTRRSASCAQGRVPVYGINATTVSDIQEAVKFAAAFNLKLVVKNTGHDFLGRGLGEGGLLLWTHHFQFFTYSDNFVPEHGNAAGLSAITLGPGVQWRDAYDFVNSKNKSIVGAICAEGVVGAVGGWPLGGGHSILSPSLGLGVDNVLQISAIIANGSYVTANAYQNADLFWAMRGGGGPSFGIATSITYKVHPIDPLYAYFFEASLDNSNTFTQVMNSWHSVLPALADAGWSGYYPFDPYSFSLQYVLPNGNPRMGNATLGTWLAKISNIPGVKVTLSKSIQYPGFHQWHTDNVLHPAHDVGYDFAAASWLLPRSLFEARSTVTAISAAFSGFHAGIGKHVAGGVVSAIDADAAGMHPAWRTALVNVVVGGVEPNGADVLSTQRAVSDKMAPLRALTPGGGQYLNEPDPLVPNFQTANWGSHYDRLLDIKKAVDPNDLFIVRQGVGSEAWDAAQNCRVAFDSRVTGSGATQVILGRA